MKKRKDTFDFSRLEEYLKDAVNLDDMESGLSEAIIYIARNATRFDDLGTVEWLCSSIAEAYDAIRYIIPSDKKIPGVQ